MTTRCRIYYADCINPDYCDKADACCAGDPDCKPSDDKIGMNEAEFAEWELELDKAEAEQKRLLEESYEEDRQSRRIAILRNDLD